MRREAFWLLVAVVVLIAVGLTVQGLAPVHADPQGGAFGAAGYACPGVVNGNSCIFTPTLLGVNALTEPAAGTSALSSVVDARGMREANLLAACTAGAWTINVQTYAEDGATTLALVVPVTAIVAGTNTIMQLGSEDNPTANTGTVSTTAIVRFPQRAIAFSFTNAGGAGTCTARLFASY